MLHTKNLENKIATALILLLFWVLALSVISPVISKQPDNIATKVANQGAIKEGNGIEIYWDQKGTDRASSITWGSLEPGMNKTVTLFILNKDKEPATLHYYDTNWQPSEIADHLILSWDYSGQPINFRELIKVVFTLHVSENMQMAGAFSFDITIISDR